MLHVCYNPYPPILPFYVLHYFCSGLLFPLDRFTHPSFSFLFWFHFLALRLPLSTWSPLPRIPMCLYLLDSYAFCSGYHASTSVYVCLNKLAHGELEHGELETR